MTGQQAACTASPCGHALTDTGHCSVLTCPNHWHGCERHGPTRGEPVSRAEPMDLGNLNDSLRLHCKACGWRPPEDAVMEAVQLHCQVEHDTDQVTLDLLPVCPCGATMQHTVTRPTGGGFKDYMGCGACGSNGFVKRDA